MASIKQYNQTDEIAVIKWVVADLASALEEQGIPATDENIQRVLDNRAAKTLAERSTDDGWNILHTVIANTKFD